MEKMIIVKSDQVNLNKLGNQIQSQEKCWSKKKLCPLYEQNNRNWNPTPSINNQSQKANQPQKNKKDSKLLFWSVNSINDFLF